MLSGKQSHVRDLTPSHEHYLRAIWAVRHQRGYARLTDVARELGVAPATLSVALRVLESRGLVEHDDRRFLLLTESGERVARQVHHRYSVLKAFLGDVLKVDPERADREACLIEHDISSTTTDRLVDLLRLLREDGEMSALFQQRFDQYHRTCAPGSECMTCGLSCLTAPPANS